MHKISLFPVACESRWIINFAYLFLMLLCYVVSCFLSYFKSLHNYTYWVFFCWMLILHVVWSSDSANIEFNIIWILLSDFQIGAIICFLYGFRWKKREWSTHYLNHYLWGILCIKMVNKTNEQRIIHNLTMSSKIGENPWSQRNLQNNKW